MTNRKLKLAAMSVALTACVAAQPMAAHAVEGPDADTDDTATPQAAPADEDAADSTTPDAADGEEEKQEEFTPPVNEEAKEEEQAPAFGPGTSTDNINIAYKPAVKPEEEPGESGDAGESGNAGDAGDAGDTDDTKQPDGTYMKGDVIDTSKKDETTGEAGQVIGSATKEETPESSSSTTVVDPDAEVKKTETVGKDEDGNTTITTKTETTGTETTTTTGTGTAKSDTKETEKGDKIDLNEELKNKDGVVENPTWETKTDDTLGGYTVDKVDTAEDGNSKTLTLKKTDTTEEKKMSAEDIAKLLDVPEGGVEKKTDDEGNTTYILKKEETSTDENGNTVTRVTYYEIDNETNSVKTTTTTTLVLKVEKGTVDGKQNVTETPMLPSIIVTNENDHNDSFTIKPSDLDYMLKHPYSKDGNVYTYVESDDTSKRTYTITKTDEKSGDYTYKEIAELLNNKLGTTGYTADDNGVYYKGNQLSITDMNAAHMVLSYTVKVDEERYNKGQYENDHAKADAEEAAKLAAIKNALKEAAKKAGINTADTNFDEELKKITSTEAGRITFTYTDDDDIKHEVTFYYNGAEITGDTIPTPSTDPKVDGKDSNDIKDVMDNTVTGTAYVTGGSESWSKSETITGDVPYLSDDFKTANGLPEDAKVERENNDDPNSRITKITIGDDVYTFTYTDNATLTDEDLENLQKDAAKKGLTLGDITNTDFTIVSWTKTTTTNTSDTTQTGSVSDKKDTIVEGKDGKDNISYTIKVDGQTYEGFTTADGGKTYTKTEGNKTTTITVTNDTLAPEKVKELLAKKYDVDKDSITLNDDGTASWNTADNTTVTVSYADITQKLTVTETTTDSVNKTELKALIAAVQEKVNKLEKGDKLTLKGKQTYTITMDANGQLSMKDNVGEVVEGTANVEERLPTIIEEIATNYIDYGSLKPEDIWNLLDQQQGYADGNQNKYTGPGGCDSYWPEAGYENNGGEWKNDQYVVKKDQYGNIIGETPAQPTTNFDHLGLDADVDITTRDGSVINGLLLSDGLTFTYGRKEQIAGYVDMDKYPDKNYNGSQYYDKSELHKTTGALDAKLDTEVKQTAGQIWNGSDYIPGSKLTYTFQDDDNTNAFSGKRFYKVTGKVAYNKTNEVTSEKEAQDLVDNLKTMQGKTEARYVAVKLQNNTTVYYVYSDVADIEAIGYMTASANTAANQNRNGWHPGIPNRPYDGYSNAGDYDLRIQGLTLVNGKVQGNYGVDYSLGMELIHNAGSESNGTLNVRDYTTTTVTRSYGNDEYGSYTASYTKDLTKEGGVKGEGTGSYKTFTEILKSVFTGTGESTYDEGGFSYSHRTPDEVTTSAVSKTTETKTDAHVDYNYTTIETRKVPVTSEVTVVVPPVDPDTPEIPDTPDTPVQDETPDEVVTPETPELPPVQDATPDEVVLPADPELPAVQDATALPQTGVNWFTALGMAFSGMLLMIAGAFTSLKYKEKH